MFLCHRLSSYNCSIYKHRLIGYTDDWHLIDNWLEGVRSMNAAIVALLCAAIFIVAQRLYGRFLSKRVFVIDERATTPAHALRDDLDYVPAPPPVLFGHHFASIAGLGPIIGPAIAVIWGWVPALIWMVLATILLVGMKDLT